MSSEQMQPLNAGSHEEFHRPGKMKKIKPLFKTPFGALSRFRPFRKRHLTPSSTSRESVKSEPTLADYRKVSFTREPSVGENSGFEMGSRESTFDLKSSSDCLSKAYEGGDIALQRKRNSSEKLQGPFSLPGTVTMMRKHHKTSEEKINRLSLSSSEYGEATSTDIETLAEDLHGSSNTLIPSDVIYGNTELLLKVLVIGDPGVGKTSFVQRYTANSFRDDYKGTVGVDFAIKMIKLPGGGEAKLQLWDIAGQERFTWMTRVYYRESHGCIVMLDLGSRRSLEGVSRWKTDLDSKICQSDGSPLPCLLLANKCDLMERCVTTEEVEDLSKRYNFLGWCEISAREDLMVENSMNFFVNAMVERQVVPMGDLDQDGQILSIKEQPKSNQHCCS